MKIKYDYDTIPYQKQFHFSRKPKVYLSTGYGGGKTYALVMKMFQLCSENPHVAGGILCPTLKMFKRDVNPTIYEICSANKIPMKYNKTDTMYYFPTTNSKVYVFHSEDDGQSIKGPNLGWFVVNEIANCSELAFLTALSRIRDKRANLPQIAMSSTPEGFNWTYNYFVQNPREDTELIIGDSRNNSFVLKDYFANLGESYDDLMREMYIEGKWVNLNGKSACYAFDRRKHTDPNIAFNPIYPTWVSLDFNVSPLAANMWQHKTGYYEPMARFKSENELYAFDEITLKDANTWAFCDALQVKLDHYGLRKEDVIIYPDPAGAARSTKSHVSDFDILKERGFGNIRYKTKLSVRDCINATNALFSKGTIKISTQCKELIADIEQCRFKDGVFEIDKSDPKRSHWLDGMKNLIDYEFPVRKYTPARSERIR